MKKCILNWLIAVSIVIAFSSTVFAFGEEIAYVNTSEGIALLNQLENKLENLRNNIGDPEDFLNQTERLTREEKLLISTIVKEWNTEHPNKKINTGAVTIYLQEFKKAIIAKGVYNYKLITGKQFRDKALNRQAVSVYCSFFSPFICSPYHKDSDIVGNVLMAYEVSEDLHYHTFSKIGITFFHYFANFKDSCFENSGNSLAAELKEKYIIFNNQEYNYYTNPAGFDSNKLKKKLKQEGYSY